MKDHLNLESDDYLIYVYADTKNVKLSRDLVKDLPVYGNNIIWVDSSNMDPGQIVNHVVLTVGQDMNTEEPINFYIASKTTKYEKAVQMMNTEGVPVEQIGAVIEKAARKAKGRPGRPKRVKTQDVAAEDKPRRKPGRPPKAKVEEEGIVEEKTAKKPGRPPKAKMQIVGTEEEMPRKKPGRPKRIKTDEELFAEAKPKKKPGRKPKAEKEATAKPAKRGRKPKSETASKPAKKRIRIDKPVTEDMVRVRMMRFPTTDPDVEQMQKEVFFLRKVQRPKFDNKLSEMIQNKLGVGEAEADSIVRKMKETGMMTNEGLGGRLIYQD